MRATLWLVWGGLLAVIAFLSVNWFEFIKWGLIAGGVLVLVSAVIEMYQRMRTSFHESFFSEFIDMIRGFVYEYTSLFMWVQFIALCLFFAWISQLIGLGRNGWHEGLYKAGSYVPYYFALFVARVIYTVCVIFSQSDLIDRIRNARWYRPDEPDTYKRETDWDRADRAERGVMLGLMAILLALVGEIVVNVSLWSLPVYIPPAP